ncbi:heterokaryon incompatibility protein-domain-containing protein [Xylariales sp. PMI_506]|nr:heterokaryon incompatibility protein-domain-containing protein [Xylariales sp. PMI_506]
MGYSQIWKVKPSRQWLQAWPRLVADARIILDAADVDLTSDRIWGLSEVDHQYQEADRDEALRTLLSPPPAIVDDQLGILFNGIHDDGCEPFVLDKIPQPESYGDPYTYTCKTNRRPYDTVVCAILTRAKQLAGDSFIAGLPSREDAASENDGWSHAYSLIDLLWPNETIPAGVDDWESDKGSDDKDDNDIHDDDNGDDDNFGQHNIMYSSESFGRQNQGTLEMLRMSVSQHNTQENQALKEYDIPHEPSSSLTGTALKWILECDAASAGHENCRPYESQPRSLLMRLVDITNRCVVTAPNDVPYAALSYVWGSFQQPKLLTSNIDLLMERDGFLKHEVDIPKTIAHAMEECKRIGYRYIWVDSLCILQDNPHDKILQLNKMRDIYRNASITIVAANGSDANAGLEVIDVNKTYHSTTENPAVWASFLDSLIGTIWDTRGWTFQEKLLSRRLLVFSPGGPFFVCQNLISSPLGSQRISTELVGIDRPGGLSNTKSGMQLELYLDLVQRYSKRKLTLASDFANAMKGITKAFGYAMYNRPNGFYQGLPTSFFDELFCWRTKEHDPTARRQGFRSWSWQGWDQTPIFPDHIMDKIKWKRENGFTGSRMLGYDRVRGNCWTDLDAKGINNSSDLNPLMLNWTGGPLEVSVDCAEDVGATNGLFRVFSPANGHVAGMITLHKEWRTRQPALLEFLPVATDQPCGGAARIKTLMCLERSDAPSRNCSSPESSFERVQLMDCDIGHDEWKEMIAGSPATHGRWTAFIF